MRGSLYVEELAMQNLFEKRGAIEANPSIDAYRAYYKLALSGKRRTCQPACRLL